jgi:hypothetical protein
MRAPGAIMNPFSFKEGKTAPKLSPALEKVAIWYRNQTHHQFDHIQPLNSEISTVIAKL